MSFLDVNAPDTSWRGTEDPIPVLLGRYPITAFAYRWVSCRPLDGHARTDATFFRAGGKAYSKTGRARPYQYWPGWKRGLLLTRVPVLLAPASAVAAANEHWLDAGPWWAQWPGATLPWVGHAAYYGVAGWRYARNRKHNRHVVQPITAAAVNLLRTRDITVEIPRSLVRAEHSSDVGKVWLPMDWAGPEGDRDNLVDMLQERLGSQVQAEFDMSGRRPVAKLTIPKQPPRRVGWEQMLQLHDTGRPYLGQSSAGSVFWDLGDDSPHIGIVGGSGSGKSELMAWIVAQFMRAGAGVVVLDPKNTSHRWLLQIPEVLYCSTGAMIHDTIIWMDEEMDRRAAANQRAAADIDFPRLVVVLEERNSLQDKLRDHWADVRPSGASLTSPALRALDRLSSMGRTLHITVLLAAQATAQQDIGRKGNYGSWAIAGRMAANHYKNIGVSPKPGIAGKPGRFAYVVGGQPTVFQAAYPNLKERTDRLRDWATGGNALLNVKEMMTQRGSGPFPSSTPVSSDHTESFITLREFSCSSGIDITKLRNAKARTSDFPQPVSTVGGTHRYRESDLSMWAAASGLGGTP